MTKTFLNPSELIPGYSTVDRIGGGGYGEVWRVKAPGGLDKAIKVLEQIPAENNKIIKQWKELGFEMENGFDSQGFLELKKNYCDQKACLKCNLGISLVKEGLENYGVAV